MIFVRYDPRGRLIKYNVAEEDDVEKQGVEYVSNEELEEDEPNVLEDNAILKNDVDEDRLEIDIDDDVAIINPLNTFLEPEDIDVELDEEREDESY